MNTAAALRNRLASLDLYERYGWVEEVVGLSVKVRGPQLSIGQICRIDVPGKDAVMAEVIGFQKGTSVLAPYEDLGGVAPGQRVHIGEHVWKVPVSPELLGRVIDGLGRPIDNRGAWRAERRISFHAFPPNALERPRVHQVLPTGIRAIDGFLSVGQGQRLGIFAGSGVGKSTLLGMMARGAEADVNVIALVGERGREVSEFIQETLGDEGMSRSVVVVATSDQPALLRLKAALLATSLAEYFRNMGMRVLLLMDSVTRIAMAQREVGLAAGEPPTARGYTPSVFSLLPRILERAGNNCAGSITAFYTVLVDGDDMNEPIADAVRGILDGHIVLSRKLAERGHFPAIDLLASVSRLLPQITTREHRAMLEELREDLAVYREAEDLIQVGAYQAGSDPAVDRAMHRMESLIRYLRQDTLEVVSWDETLRQMSELVSGAAQ